MRAIYRRSSMLPGAEGRTPIHRIQPSHAGAEASRQFLHREQQRARKGRAQRDDVLALGRIQHLEHKAADINGGSVWVAVKSPALPAVRAMRADVVARSRPGVNFATILQQAVRLQHGAGADRPRHAGLAHRRHAIAGAQHTGMNLRGNFGGELFVTLHAGHFDHDQRPQAARNLYRCQTLFPATVMPSGLHRTATHREGVSASESAPTRSTPE